MSPFSAIRTLQAAMLVIASLTSVPSLLPAQTPPVLPAPSRDLPLRDVTDDLGRSIRIPSPVKRIVSLAPSLTETLYILGLQDLLVGDTNYCDFPPDARNKPKVGGALNPSLEAIADLHPDLVLVTKSFNRLDTVESLQALGIPSYATDPHTVEDILSSTRRLADILGAPEAGVALANNLQLQLVDVHRRLAALPPRRVLFVVWREPLISIGKETFIADALLHAGATSVVDSAQNWPQVNLEEIVRLQPDYLVFAQDHSEETPSDIAVLASLPGWRILDAVKNRRYAVVSDAVNRPSPRIVSAIRDLASQLHPEAFPLTPQDPQEQPGPSDPAHSDSLSSVLFRDVCLPPSPLSSERPCAR